RLGVIPDITFPSYTDPQEFGESSQISSLPWDKINPANYKLVSNLSEILPMLLSSSEKRRNNNFEFQYLKEDIQEYKISKNQKYLSLNEALRKQKKEEDDEKEFQRENERRKLKGLKLLEKGEVPEKIDEENDIFLTETAMIVTDMINLPEGITKVR
ncbi:MAG: carboxy terminal-processing peptidase, partial [Ignavibacteriaceae bacterium]